MKALCCWSFLRFTWLVPDTELGALLTPWRKSSCLRQRAGFIVDVLFDFHYAAGPGFHVFISKTLVWVYRMISSLLPDQLLLSFIAIIGCEFCLLLPIADPQIRVAGHT